MTDDSTLEIRGDGWFWGHDGEGWPDEIVAIDDDRNESRAYRLVPTADDGPQDTLDEAWRSLDADPGGDGGDE